MKAVIFDVDGTLYDQRKLRIRLLFDMLRSALRRPAVVSDLNVIRNFRKAREQLGASGAARIARGQFLVGSRLARTSPERVRRLVDQWMVNQPLAHLPDCRYDGVGEFFDYLRSCDARIGVFSDYPAEAKLAALGLTADVVLSAEDQDVDRLKPDPTGLRVAADRLGLPVGACMMIGDRDDKDGECARRAGMTYLIMQEPKARFFLSDRVHATISEWIRS